MAKKSKKRAPKNRARRRWRCPTGEHPDILAYSIADDSDDRFCPECSKKANDLVPRLHPSFKPPKSAQPPPAQPYVWMGVDLSAELDRLIKKRVDYFFADVRADGSLDGWLDYATFQPGYGRMPIVLHVRRCARRPAHTLGYAKIEDGFADGLAHPDGQQAKISLTTWPSAPIERVLNTLVHELAHVVQYVRFGTFDHGPTFKSEFAAIFDAGYNIKLDKAALKNARRGMFMTAEGVEMAVRYRKP